MCKMGIFALELRPRMALDVSECLTSLYQIRLTLAATRKGLLIVIKRSSLSVDENQAKSSHTLTVSSAMSYLNK